MKWLSEVQQAYAGSRRGNRETHGLDTDFARQTYVPTGLEEELKAAILKRRYRLAVLCGNAGDGKTALLQRLALLLGHAETRPQTGPVTLRPAGGPLIEMNLDGSSAWDDRSSDAALDDFLAPFANGQAPAEDIARLLAINDGRLLEWAAQRHTPLAATLRALLEGRPTDAPHIAFIHLNRRALVGSFALDGALDTSFLDALADQLYGGNQASQIWSKCHGCAGQPRCEAFRAARLFGPANLPGAAAAERRQLARRRLYAALQAVHLRGESHIAIRDLRGALAYILFGTASCDAYCQEKPYPPYWERAFSATTPYRQGRLLEELSLFDPALEADARLDRALLKQVRQGFARDLADARRRAYFEWTDAEAAHAGGPGARLDVARGRHLDWLRRLPFLSEVEKRELLRRLCHGLSRVESLPAVAYARAGAVPLRLSPRAPTETVFWVEARLTDFRLEADLQPTALLDADNPGRRGLHRQAFLTHRSSQGGESRLSINADLFHVLLELDWGYRLSAATMDETFAHLTLFIERLIRAQAGEIYAWHPLRASAVYRLELHTRDLGWSPHQRLTIAPVGA
ncbi:MAG: hypothetical protein CFK52_02285 [Chloracidobacterium sp. CP2_5A]|nr:MAG: hypothetical protein CFK52_02285 [Chloracidobacterium sp. CP2_5A]